MFIELTHPKGNKVLCSLASLVCIQPVENVDVASVDGSRSILLYPMNTAVYVKENYREIMEILARVFRPQPRSIAVPTGKVTIG